MDLEYREYQFLEGNGDTRQVRIASARIRECGSHGYQVELRCNPNTHEAQVVPTMAEARAVVEQAVAEADQEIERARRDARQTILAHPWWLAAVGAEELDRILELASIHSNGVVLVDPHGGYSWAPDGTWHTGCHVRLEIPPGGHCSSSATFALLQALNEVHKQAASKGRVKVGVS